MKAWLKCGLIGGGVSILMILCGMFIFDGNISIFGIKLRNFFIIKFIFIIFAWPILIIPPYALGGLLFVGIICVLLWCFFLGAIIGFIIGKIKQRKGVVNVQ